MSDPTVSDLLKGWTPTGRHAFRHGFLRLTAVLRVEERRPVVVMGERWKWSYRMRNATLAEALDYLMDHA